MERKRVLKTRAVTSTSPGSLSEIDIEYKLANDSEVTGYGAFFHDKSSIMIINEYWEDLAKEESDLKRLKKELDELRQRKKENSDGTDKENTDTKELDFLDKAIAISDQLVNSLEISLDNRIVAVEIGKEMLMMILSQPKCEGLRFYQARGVLPEEVDNETQYKLKNPGETTLVAVGMDIDGNDLGVSASKKNTSIMNRKGSKVADTMQSETNPPRTMKELKGDSDNFEDVIKEFSSFK
ncbi:hypothetical protein [Dyadobacter sp. Leaf189]|uniref:hypothetical protein n=1 Tax=Dyadobacter sp. Leaf189 TaxID=1736295 RepID=UPI0006FBE2D0|nr:hypothetical protein [Dyadobacter sp. Leaf189]KQS33828.1 hypothetical protein ASG33_07210 [Dyadobacter sp. Leaf189]